MTNSTLRRLVLLLPLLVIGAVLLIFSVLNTGVSWKLTWLIYGVLVGGTLFTVWVFRFIAEREAEARLRSEQLEALHNAALALTRELDLGTVLQQVVDQARTLAGAKYGALGVLEEGGEFIDQFITSGISAEQRAALGPLPRGHGLLGVLIKAGASIRVPDIAADPRSVGFPPNHPEMRSLLGVPIQFKGEVLGDLYLTDKMTISGVVTEFTGQDQHLLEMFATQAAIAIVNAQLYRQSQQLALLQERERFGMDLHDGVIQSIYAVGLMLEDTQYRAGQEPEAVQTGLPRAIDALNEVIRDLRNYILDLRPQRFQGRDLAAGLAELARELRAHSFLEVDVRVDTQAWSRLSPEQTLEILHIAREALTNIRKHARANRVEIVLAERSDGLLLAITDNGLGFEPGQAAQGGGHGLNNMQERAGAMGGTIAFVRREGGGMGVELLVPVDPIVHR